MKLNARDRLELLVLAMLAHEGAKAECERLAEKWDSAVSQRERIRARNSAAKVQRVTARKLAEALADAKTFLKETEASS